MPQEVGRMMRPSRPEVATLAGGCFWCLEAVFDELEGVQDVVSGYAGGSVPHPTYKQVCNGDTGHAEVAQVTFDPAVLSYRDLLKVFFAIHDPTTLNRQGGDVGTQYRSGIFTHNDAQEKIADEVIAELNAGKIYDDPIVTEVVPAESFYPAEDYHQEYFRRNPNQGYCRMVIAPKVAKFRKEHLARLKRVG
ncbi:MAG TPA: peptide-methionine (S)-S-oxide reductase MsrA [bacterium]